MDRPSSRRSSAERHAQPEMEPSTGVIAAAHDPASAVAATDPEKMSTVRNESDTEVGKKEEREETKAAEAGLEGGSTTADEGTGAEEPQEEHEYIAGVRLLLVLAALTATTFLMLLDMSIITTITTAFNSLSDVGWYGAAYNLTSAALQPFAGKLYTYLSSKWTFLAFLFLFEVGSLICGVATSSDMLIVGRAVAGMGSAGLYNGALTIIGNSVPLAKRPLIIGIIIGLANMGLVTGPLVGGALTEYSTWRWCFYINIPIGGVVAVLLVFIHIPDRVTNPLPLLKVLPLLDLPGFVLFAPAAVMFLLALQFGGNDYAWGSSVVIGLFVGAGVAALLFLLWERRVGDAKAMVPLGLFKRRIVTTSSLVGGFNLSLTLVGSYYLPLYFQSVKGESPFRGGVDYLPTILAQLLSAVASGALVGRLGYYLPWVVFGSVFGAVGSGLISTFTPTTSTGMWIGYQIILGIGRGSSMQMQIIAIQANLPPAMMSVSMATLVFIQTLFSAALLTFAQLIFSEGLKDNLPKYAPSVDARTVLAAGGTGFRTVVAASELPGVLVAYAVSVCGVFSLCVGLAGTSFVLAWGMGWVDIRDKKKGGKGEA